RWTTESCSSAGFARTARRRAGSRSIHWVGASWGPVSRATASRPRAPAGANRSRTWATFMVASLSGLHDHQPHEDEKPETADGSDHVRSAGVEGGGQGLRSGRWLPVDAPEHAPKSDVVARREAVHPEEH